MLAIGNQTGTLRDEQDAPQSPAGAAVSVLCPERIQMMPLPRHDPAELIAKLRLAALPNAVGSARRFVRQQLPLWRLDDFVDDVALVVSELTSNSVKATGTETVPKSYPDLYDAFLVTVILRLRLTSTDLYAEVWDASNEPPVLARPTALAESGRGLVLVDEFGDEWGYYPSQLGGKVTWTRFQVKPQQTPYLAAQPVQRDVTGHFRIADPSVRRALDVLADLSGAGRGRPGHAPYRPDPTQAPYCPDPTQAERQDDVG